MPINIEIKVVPFGQLRFEIGKPVPSLEESPAFITKEPARYHEPKETSSQIYEVQYKEKPKNYIAPPSTG